MRVEIRSRLAKRIGSIVTVELSRKCRITDVMTGAAKIRASLKWRIVKIVRGVRVGVWSSPEVRLINHVHSISRMGWNSCDTSQIGLVGRIGIGSIERISRIWIYSDGSRFDHFVTR